MHCTEKQVTGLMIFTTILWIFLLVGVWINNNTLVFFGFLSSIFLLLSYFFLSNIQHNRIKDATYLFMVMISSALLWLIAFITLYLTKGHVGKTLFMGFYGGPFLVLLSGWIGILVLVSVSYAKYFDRLIPEEKWKSFLKDLKQLKIKKRVT